MMNLFLFVIMVIHSAMGAYKVFNGDPVTDWSATEFKYMVHLFDPRQCTGSWLGGNKVLTAAHCTCKKPPLNFAMFEKTSKDAAPTETIPIVSEEHNPEYKKCDIKTDTKLYRGVDVSVAILKTAPVSKKITVIPIEFTKQPSIGTIVTIAGYGLDENKIKGSLKIDQAKVIACSDRYPLNPMCLEPVKEHRYQKTLSADSGSPMLWKQGSKHYGCGVLSGHEEYDNDPNHFVMVFATTKQNEAFIKKHL